MLWNLVAPGYPPIGLNTATYAFVNSEAAALVARFATQPTDARKRLIDTLIGSLKTAGVWTKFDAFYMLAAADSQAARQNWIADQYNLAAVSGPTFTVDRGYSGDGAASYLATGFNPTTAVGPKFLRDSASMYSYVNTSVAGTINTVGSTSSFLRNYVAATGSIAAANCGQKLIAAANSLGSFGFSRTGATAYKLMRSGVMGIGETDASIALTNAAFAVLARMDTGGPSGFYSGRAASVFFGEGATDAELLAADTAITTFLTAIGAS